jgi:DNA-binding MarR family transcriptional regulator
MDYSGVLSYSSAMPADRDHPAKPAAPPAAGSLRVDDLTWLAYRAADALGEAFNKVSRDAGLADLRDWLVLALISGDGTQRTQLEIATQLGIDKSTLVPLLDRLERDGLIIRSTSERDRRVRIPQATPAGIKVVKQGRHSPGRRHQRPPRRHPPSRAGQLPRHAMEDRGRRGNAAMSRT